MARLLAHPSGPLTGRIAAPGDKSISHRAIILAAMAAGESRIVGLADGEDVLRTLAAVRQLGAKTIGDDGAWRISGGSWRSPERPIDCGNSGTGARLLMGAIAGRPVTAQLTGDLSLRRRPMGRVADPLRRMGARIEGGERLPLTVTGGRLRPLCYHSPVPSAQVKSAILLAGLGGDAEVEVVEAAPTRDHSEILLRAFGCDVEVEGLRVRLGRHRTLRPASIEIAGDPSSAAFPLVAALLVPGSEVTVTGMLMNKRRTGFLDALTRMGADLRIANRRTIGGEEAADVTARASRLRAAIISAEQAPATIDEYPALAVAAAFAEGETVMEGLAELRVKESDRLAALASGLKACGVAASVQGDSLTVQGGPAGGGGRIESADDHRIAMAFLVLGLAARAPVLVDGAEAISTSYPAFAATMRGLGARIENA
jgi:3-phosphoshikimate 1-carboxyvinyltransferase